MEGTQLEVVYNKLERWRIIKDEKAQKDLTYNIWK